MADVRYVVQDYSDEDYLEVGSTLGYFEFEYVANGYVASVVSADAALTSSFAQQATGVKCRISSLTTTSQATVVSTGVKCRIGDAVISIAANLTAIPLQIVPAENFTLADSIVLSATPTKIFGADAQLTTEFTQLAIPLRIQPAAADFTAFNTVVTAAGRIRPAADFSALNATLTATPTKVFGASTNTIEAYLATQFPVAGVHLTEDSYANGVGYLLYRDSTSFNQSQFFSSSTVIAFYARAESQTAGVIFSFSGDGINRIPWTFTMGGNGLTVSGSGSRTWTNLPTITDIHHYAIHFGGTNGTTLYVDGIIQTNYTGGVSAPGVGWYENYPVLYLGRSRTIVNFGLPGQPNNYQEVQSDWWEGDLAQVWIGRPTNGRGLASPQFVRITGYRFDTFESFGIYGNMQESQVTTVGTNMPNGAGTDDTLSQPNFYAEFNDWTPAGTMDQVYFASYPLQGNFTLTPTAFKLVYGEASLASAFSITATLGKLQPSSVSVESASTFSATAYDFTKAVAILASEFTTDLTAYDFTKGTAALSSEFTLTPNVDEISSGASLVLATVSMTVDGSALRAPSAALSADTNLQGTGNTNQLAYSDVTAVFAFTATDYDFTKGTVALDTALTIEATARIFSPPRGTLLSGMQATLTATPLKLRIQTSTIQSSATLLVADGNALRSGSISMTAFDTVLSAGKIIEFLEEHIVTVTEEQRLLKVALESTVLLVEMANGVNTVMAESTDTKVAQEQGVLLAQYNMPN